ncbi:MAG: M1 family aminopeptidase [Bacteroidales bacterium]|nr:M1 family aminopeptidase [Bacteroidales bacterium]
MKKYYPRTLFLLSGFLILTLLASCNRMEEEEYTEEGVSKLLATYRKTTISDVVYRLEFTIPEGKEDPISGMAAIEFSLTSKRQPLVIDFRADDAYLESVKVNGHSVEPLLTNGHIVIGGAHLAKSFNRVDILFRAGDMSLNRNDDYLYTLFVPDRASTAFPCFDQPDLKARYSLTLNLPADYRAMSNSPVTASDTTGDRVVIRFAETKPISTYLFAFAAGRFELVEKEIDGVRMEMLHRETRPEYIENNAGEIFRLHHSSLKWLEEYTQIPYPFDKFGFVLIPSFQYSGMEHPGSILYRASSLLLEATPTLNEELSRASLIAHETSHIWFGDLVTMKWFDDVWLKEVFAGYMSDLIVKPDFPHINHDLRFLLSRYPAAYDVDRTRGTNPVIQELSNMKDAGSLYGAIIYNKAPIVMRQLEKLAGEDNLRQALQIYLRDYSWGNARWDDLIAIIEKVTREPLEVWSRMWVREAGMAVITPVIAREEGYRVSFREDDPAGTIRHWPQTLDAMVITASDTITGEVQPAGRKSFITAGGEPVCIIPDISGRAYGTFLFDSGAIVHLKIHINEFKDPLLRGILWINMYENLVNGTVSPADFYSAVFSALEAETDLQIRNYLSGRFSSVYWHYLADDERSAVSADAEQMIRNKITLAGDASEKRTWYGLYRGVAVTETGLAWLEGIWNNAELPGEVKLSEDELCTLALTLALKGHPDAEQIIAAQRDRITGTDRLQRYEFVLPSVSPDSAVRDAFFETLRDPAGREHEPWVLEALGYLHHPMVARRAEKYILPSMEMLGEIKRTGDIFFPERWITITLAGHHSAEARETVEKFLDDRADYPADLRLKILQAADHLFRQQRGER